MGITFNADEILAMAENIEQNGAVFYRKAAENASDPGVKQLLLDFAAMEDGHYHIFSEMRKNLTDDQKKGNTFDPDDQAVLYLNSMAQAHGWEGKSDVDLELTGSETAEQIIKTAIAAEKDSVVFYTGMKEVISAAAREKLDLVIKEELLHIRKLTETLKSLK